MRVGYGVSLVDDLAQVYLSLYLPSLELRPEACISHAVISAHQGIEPSHVSP